MQAFEVTTNTRTGSLELVTQMHEHFVVTQEARPKSVPSTMVNLTVKTIKGKKFQIDVEQSHTVSLGRNEIRFRCAIS